MPVEIADRIKLLSPKEKEALRMTCEQEVCHRDPFWMVESGYMLIKTKSGEMIPLKLKKSQLKLHKILKDLWEGNKIIRIFVLKARQTGITTYIQALIYSIVSHTPNTNAIDIADDLDGSNYIFEMSKFYHEHLPGHLVTPTKKSNEKKMEFAGIASQVLVDTADNKNAGRKYTFRVAHLSEYAFYKDPGPLMVGLSQSVPSLPRTIIIKETTANGFNSAKDEWDMIENGQSDYVGVFIAWYEEDDYMMKAEDNFLIGDEAYGIISKDEPSLAMRMEREGVDIATIRDRLAWRRWCIRNSCGDGSDKDRVANFKQEYPSFPAEAFKASGDCYFDQESIVDQLGDVAKPLYSADIVYADYKAVARKNPAGAFRFYEAPQAGVQYVIGGDACSGSGLDFSPMVARRHDTNKIVATYYAKDDPDEFAYKAFLLGTLLNNATVAIENEKFGFAANKKLVTIYKNVYMKRLVNEKTNQITETFGWDTNAITRPMMLAQMQSEIRDGALGLADERIMKECLTFIVTEGGKAQAQNGCHDDWVIACAISGAVRQIVAVKRTPEQKKVSLSKYRTNRERTGNAGFGYK